MTDSNCTRYGYDSTGKYRVKMWKPPMPDEDQCPECRAAPGEDHNPDCQPAPDRVTIPLHKQAALYAERVDAVLDNLHAMLAPGTDYRERVIEEGFARLVAGFDVYQDAAYHWGPERRAGEMLQEVSDYAVYGTTGTYK